MPLRTVSGEVLQFLANRAVIGAESFDDRPETAAVIHFAQMRQFMDDDVIDDVSGEVDQPPVEPDAAAQAAAAPARPGGG